MRKQKRSIRIGIDLMGSDSSPEVLFEAALEAVNHLHPSGRLILFAPKEKLTVLQQQCAHDPRKASLEWSEAPQEISMEDHPLEAIRRKPFSSLMIGLQSLKEKKLDGFVSAGNTGALIVGSVLNIAMLPGIERPALVITMPTEGGNVAIVDAGGNLTCKEDHYVQFAQLGAVFQRCMRGLKCPTVGLLNVGVEPLKGHPELKKAYQHLCEYTQSFASKGETLPFRFLGNVEGRDIFQGKIDVVVTDGFTGNILLKACEGIAALIFKKFRCALQPYQLPELESAIDEMQRFFDYTEYPGALLCGLQDVVIKCHGNVTTQSMLNCILGAEALIKNRLIQNMQQHFKP
jgi:glycerol-3-phosphate acyltransferase PlsX